MVFTKYQHLSNEEIVSLIQVTGNINFLNILYKRFYKKVYGKCVSMVKNDKDAEDLTQDIWLKISTHIFNFKGASSFATWLHRITLNHCLDFMRFQRYDLGEDSLKYHYLKADDTKEYMEAKKSREMQLELIIKSLEEVDEERREILIMKYFENLGIEEIGERLNLKNSAVKMRLQRARNTLKKRMMDTSVSLTDIPTFDF
ncbi:MAG: RNA polymerase sigma factor [Chitinophagales bacterium]